MQIKTWVLVLSFYSSTYSLSICVCGLYLTFSFNFQRRCFFSNNAASVGGQPRRRYDDDIIRARLKSFTKMSSQAVVPRQQNVYIRFLSRCIRQACIAKFHKHTAKVNRLTKKEPSLLLQAHINRFDLLFLLLLLLGFIQSASPDRSSIIWLAGRWTIKPGLDCFTRMFRWFFLQQMFSHWI